MSTWICPTVAAKKADNKQGSFLNFGVGGQAAETEADRGVALVEGEPNGVENA